MNAYFVFVFFFAFCHVQTASAQLGVPYPVPYTPLELEEIISNATKQMQEEQKKLRELVEKAAQGANTTSGVGTPSAQTSNSTSMLTSTTTLAPLQPITAEYVTVDANGAFQFGNGVKADVGGTITTESGAPIQLEQSQTQIINSKLIDYTVSSTEIILSCKGTNKPKMNPLTLKLDKTQAVANQKSADEFKKDCN
ncbi:hypothetical protein WR25_10646 [Diploscapter pachys]|uniref:Uncharacterized protein n=1 Tax=Diploscapter pachys TaxID=2018661 RepID=A0A2A2M0W9_9BILA|nr:hypothetical protein WR25_10646 [Diploscapter pachys]